MNVKTYTKEINNNIMGINIEGEIDVYTSPKVKEALNDLIQKGNNNIIVNLEGVSYIDSTGLGVLIGALKRVKENNGDIKLVCTNLQIKKIFDITGLVKIFELYDSEELAIKG
ncbi:MAG: STAS domain-containing protein [Candidatus Eremiobacterota bacterium]|mgnify:FL=1